MAVDIAFSCLLVFVVFGIFVFGFEKQKQLKWFGELSRKRNGGGCVRPAF